MSNKKNINSQLTSLSTNSNNSRNSKTGYMETGNAGKLATKQGTKNKK